MLCSTPRAVPLSRFFSAILLLLSVVSKSRKSALSDYVVSRKRDPALASRKKLGVHVDCVYAAPCGNKFGRSSRDSVLLVRFTLTRFFRVRSSAVTLLTPLLPNCIGYLLTCFYALQMNVASARSRMNCFCETTHGVLRKVSSA